MTTQNPFNVTSYWQIKQLTSRMFHFKLDINNKSKDELLDMWNELYEYYLFLLTRVDNIGFMEAKNLKITKDVDMPTQQSIHYTPYHFDKFKSDRLMEQPAPPEMWEEFKQDIFERGSFFVFIVSIVDHHLQVFQGTHRITAIMELINAGKLPEDFKVLCIENNARDRDIINQIAIQLGRLENKLRNTYNIKLMPHPEFSDEKFFGYLHRLPTMVKCPTLDKRFKMESFTP